MFTALRNVFALQNTAELSYQAIETEVDMINSITGVQPSYVTLPPLAVMTGTSSRMASLMCGADTQNPPTATFHTW